MATESQSILTLQESARVSSDSKQGYANFIWPPKSHIVHEGGGGLVSHELVYSQVILFIFNVNAVTCKQIYKKKKWRPILVKRKV